MNQTALDFDELLHIAIAAVLAGRHDTAIATLKQCVEEWPDRADAHYLLGGEYLQIGLYDRAGPALEQALRLDPALHTARLQLGLLKMAQEDHAAAAEVWRELDALGPEDPLYLFKTGMLCVADGDTEGARACIRAGVERNLVNAPLNQEMLAVLARLDGPDAG